MVKDRFSLVCRRFALAFALLVVGSGPGAAEPPARIISLNMCTDQLLLDLVEPGRIAGLSPYARDPDRSWASARAGDRPVLSGGAEEVMVIRPDLVVTNRFGGRATHDFIRRRGVRLVEFDLVTTISDAKSEIAAFGDLVGAEARAHDRIAAIDAAMARLSLAAAGRSVRVLPLARRGWVSGRSSLVSDLLAKAGLVNVAAELGFEGGGFVGLEAIARLRPDAILLPQLDPRADDQGNALLAHPALAMLFPPERRLYIPEKLTICGGPSLAEAIDALAAALPALPEPAKFRP